MSSFPPIPADSFVEDRQPRFDASLPRQLAHKQAVEEIFLTDVIVRKTRGDILACAQLPRSHALHNEIESGFHDLLLILEIGRQGMTIYGHGWLDVPEGTAFVMSGLRSEVIDVEALRQRDTPAELVIQVPFGEARRGGRGRVRGYVLKGVGRIDGKSALEFAGEALLIPEALYERLRNARVGGGAANRLPPVAVEAGRVGRRCRRNVVVGDIEEIPGGVRCALIADRAHPSFFDHPLDHVPGMLMLEAARQAALVYTDGLGWAASEAVLEACEAQFSQYAALWPPALCTVVAAWGEGAARSDVTAAAVPEAAEAGEKGLARLRATFAQGGAELGHVDMRLRRTMR